MKITGGFVKAALALWCCLGIAFGSKIDCRELAGVIHKDGSISSVCPRTLRPVCGTDGRTYNNECEICLHNKEQSASVEKAHDGECEQQQQQHMSIDCRELAGVIHKDGSISSVCPRTLRPVCGTDGRTYNNECEICLHNKEQRASVEKAHDGECEQQQQHLSIDCSQYPGVVHKDGSISVACPRNLRPVCGTDGRTYSNECGICLHNKEQRASVDKAHDGECEQQYISIDCHRYPRSEKDGHVLVACPRILKPVCGSDSSTYDNECGICAYNAEHHTNITKIHDGECKQDKIDCSKYSSVTTEDGTVLVSCPRILSPVCGTDGFTYDNECGICAYNGIHRTDVSKKHNGKCRLETSEADCSLYLRRVKDGKPRILCPRILLPVCGTDGFTYDNECGLCAHNLEHGTNVKKSHGGRCKEESTPVDCSMYLSNAKTGEAITACPFILHEICGTDGSTYSNECVLCAHNIEYGTNVAKKHEGRCTEEVPQLSCSQYPTSTTKDGKKLMACTMIYSPVCGTDGVTYASECMLCAHNQEHRTSIGKRKNGRCEEDITKEHCKAYQEPTTFCTMEYLAHCGSDGKTYSNRCDFCNAYLKSNRTLNLISMTEC